MDFSRFQELFKNKIYSNADFTILYQLGHQKVRIPSYLTTFSTLFHPLNTVTIDNASVTPANSMH